LAVQTGHVAVVKMLIDKGADVEGESISVSYNKSNKESKRRKGKDEDIERERDRNCLHCLLSMC